MFVYQSSCDQRHRPKINWSELGYKAEADERAKEQQVEQLREPKTARDTEVYHERANFFALIKIKILRRVDQIESGHPADDPEGQNKRRKIDISSLSDPGANRRNCQG